MSVLTMVKPWLLAALAVGIWLLSSAAPWRPQAAGMDAPPTEFSAARAEVVLATLLGSQAPHPVGSQAAQSFRARLLQGLGRLGVSARTVTKMSCYGERRWSTLACGTITDIVADVSPGRSSKAILLMAHTDSVAAGPGAADDGSGVAILLETIRALKARNFMGAHPIIALFTDGEEAGMLGAAAYLHDPAASQIGAVINVEARGNHGPSYLFQTSPGNGALIDLYARSLKRYATSSLYGEIYKYLPNDTDLTPMLATGAPAYNFAFIGGFAQYHTPLDRRERIAPRSLQQQGDAVLALSQALARADLAGLKAKPDSMDLDVFGLWLPRLGVSWALPLALAALAMLAVAGLIAPPRERGFSGAVLAALAPPLLLAGAVGMGFLLVALARGISHQPDPSFAHPLWLRLALGFGVFAVALLAARIAGAIACWVWLAGLALLCALYFPGITPYFLFPCLVGAPVLLATARAGPRSLAVFIGALAGMVVWIGLNQAGEAIMGLKLYPLFMVSAAMALLGCLPLLAKARGWRLSSALSFLLAIGLAAVAGFFPAFSPNAPQRLNLRYVELGTRAYWLADPVARLPQRLRAAANFSARPQRLIAMAYVAAAGRARSRPPRAKVRRQGGHVGLDLDANADAIMLLVPKAAGLKNVTVQGISMPLNGHQSTILCVTPDCGHARIDLDLSSTKALQLLLVAQSRGLPPQGAALLAARPADAVASQTGDMRWIVGHVRVPAR